MQLSLPTSEVYIPDGKAPEEALARTTHLGICAHQDDLEILAYPGILECFGKPGHWFTGVCVTNGSGSPRTGHYANYTDEQMMEIRRLEQKKAAFVGDYSAMVFLDYASSGVKDPENRQIIEDIKAVFSTCRPKVVYTHNLADKHDTHIGVVLRTIAALRELDADDLPEKVYGLEVWRDLDWMLDADKVVFDVAARENLAAALLGVFDSQISGGKRYDLATMGRRRAHATYSASHGTDESTGVVFGMDLTPLVLDPEADIKAFVNAYIQRLASDVAARIEKFL